MNLHENKELFKDAIIATSQMKNIPEIYVEKDYWVTLALYSIFQSEIGKYSVFKGGTALSKCNKLINRFSEDIDIVLLKQKRESSNQLKNKLKKITKAVEKVIPEIELEGITKINLSEALRHLCVALRNSFLGYYAAITQRYAKNHKGSQRKNTRLLIKQQKLYK